MSSSLLKGISCRPVDNTYDTTSTLERDIVLPSSPSTSLSPGTLVTISAAGPSTVRTPSPIISPSEAPAYPTGTRSPAILPSAAPTSPAIITATSPAPTSIATVANPDPEQPWYERLSGVLAMGGALAVAILICTISKGCCGCCGAAAVAKRKIITVECPACGKEVGVEPESLGQNARCYCEVLRNKAEVEGPERQDIRGRGRDGPRGRGGEVAGTDGAGNVLFHPDPRHVTACHNCEILFCVPCDVRDRKGMFRSLFENNSDGKRQETRAAHPSAMESGNAKKQVKKMFPLWICIELATGRPVSPGVGSGRTLFIELDRDRGSCTSAELLEPLRCCFFSTPPIETYCLCVRQFETLAIDLSLRISVRWWISSFRRGVSTISGFIPFFRKVNENSL